MTSPRDEVAITSSAASGAVEDPMFLGAGRLRVRPTRHDRRRAEVACGGGVEDENIILERYLPTGA